MAVANVVARFTADTGDFQRQMSGARDAFGEVSDAATLSGRRIAEVGQKVADVGKKMTIGLTLPIGGMGVAAVKAASDFEASMTKIIGLVGIASDEVAMMGQEVLGMAGNVGKAPEELASGLFAVTSAGLRGAEAMSALDASARAGAAGLGETNDIARAVSGALSAYGSEVLSASDATDAIVATARAGNFETSQFAAAIGRVLPFAQQAGATFQDMGGAVALLTRVNGNAAESITQIQALFRAFVVPTEEAKKALDGVGMSAADLRASIAEKGLPATLQMLDRALGGNREQLGRLLGSSEAASAAFQILNADGNAIRSTFGVVADSAGMTDEAFGAVAETAQFKMGVAMAELRSGLIAVGETIMPVAKVLIDYLTTWIQRFNALPGPLKTVIVAFAGMVAIVGPLLMLIGKFMVAFSALLSLFLKTKLIMNMRNQFAKLRIDLAATRTSVLATSGSFGTMGTMARIAAATVATSFRAIATAAKGLLLSLGPIGIALIAASVAFEVILGSMGQASERVQMFRDEIDETTGSLNEAGKAAVASQIRSIVSEDAMAELRDAGVTMGQLITMIEAGPNAVDQLLVPLSRSGAISKDAFLSIRSGLYELSEDVVAAGALYEQTEADKAAAAIIAATEAGNASKAALQAEIESTRTRAMQRDLDVRNAQNAARMNIRSIDATVLAKTAADRTAIDSQRALDGAMAAGVKAVEGLETAFKNLDDALSEEASADSAARAIHRLNDVLSEGEKTLKGNSEAALDNREAIRNAAQEFMDYAAAAKDPEEAQKRLAEGQREIRKAMKEQGINVEESDIFKVLKEQQQQSGETVDEFAKQRDKASQYGHDVGNNFIDGIIRELNRRRSEVENAAANAASGMNTGAAAATESQSPSRTAMAIASDFVDGAVIGLRNNAPKIDKEARRAGDLLNRAFAEALAPNVSGPASQAFAAVFGSRESIRGAARAAQDAAWALADARDAVVDAEKALAEARKKGNAREIARAERDLARARRDAADAADAAKAAEFVAENQKALLALERIAQKYDYIVNALEQVQGAFDALGDLTATPFGLDSMLSEMFGSDTNARQLATNFAQVEQVIRDAYAVLIDPQIVGRRAARRNRREMEANIAEIEQYVAQMIELRQELDAGLLEEARLEKELADITRTFDEANRDLERIVSERDGFMRKITDGLRGFVNNLSGLTDRATTEMQESTRDLGNGVRLIMQAADPTSAAGAIAANLESRLAEVRQFTANIKTLMERGLDPALIRDFIESGVSGAGETVAALAGATDAELAGINATQAELLEAAEEFATDVGATYYDPLIAGQQKIVDGIQSQVDAAQAALDVVKARNAELAEQILTLGAQIESAVNELATELPARTLTAGQDAVDRMIAGFNEKFPEMKRYFNRLMDELARSMERTITIDVQATGATRSNRANATSFNTGTVPLAAPAGTGRTVTIGANAVNVNVMAGPGTNVAEDVRVVVNEALEELAREITAA